MKTRGGVFLDYETADLRWRDRVLAAGFGGFAKIPLGLIGGKFVIHRQEDALASGYNFTPACSASSERTTAMGAR
jgi:hypothetical protein